MRLMGCWCEHFTTILLLTTTTSTTLRLLLLLNDYSTTLLLLLLLLLLPLRLADVPGGIAPAASRRPASAGRGHSASSVAVLVDLDLVLPHLA